MLTQPWQHWTCAVSPFFRAVPISPAILEVSPELLTCQCVKCVSPFFSAAVKVQTGVRWKGVARSRVAVESRDSEHWRRIGTHPWELVQRSFLTRGKDRKPIGNHYSANFGHAAWTDFEYLVRNVRSAKEKKFAGILLGDYRAAPEHAQRWETLRSGPRAGSENLAQRAGRPYAQDRGRDRRPSPSARDPRPA